MGKILMGLNLNIVQFAFQFFIDGGWNVIPDLQIPGIIPIYIIRIIQFQV